MAQHAPTLLECRDWVMEHCTNLLKTTVKDHKDYLIAVDSTRIFVNALDAPLTATRPLLENLDALTRSFETEPNTDMVVRKIKYVCEACTPWLDPASLYVRCHPTPGFTNSKYQLETAKVVSYLTSSQYTSMWPNHLNEETAWFRQYFVGNPYITFIGPLSHDNYPSATLKLTTALEEEYDDPTDDDPSYVIITVVQENIKTCGSSRRKTSPSLSSFSDKNLIQDDNDLDEYPKTTTKATGLVSTITTTIPTTGHQYRLIIRNKKKAIRCVISEETARNTLTRLEVLGQGDRLVSASTHRQKQKQKRRPLRSFSSAIIHHTSNLSSSSPSNSSFFLQRSQQHDYDRNNSQGDDDDEDDNDDTADHDDSDKDFTSSPLSHCHTQHHKQSIHRKTNESYRLLHAAVLSVYNHLDLQQFKTLTAETTILNGLEKELLRFDEMEVPKSYKFGLLSVLDDQSSEEQWFSNTGLSDDLEQFLNIIGQRITLQGYKGYAAGLDTKCGESGKYSYVTTWNENEIMFHVGPLMPYNAQDKQQVHRKRYIGNDIVCIVFVESNQPHLFDPGSIRSQFLHVFIVVHPETMNGKKCWRVEVVSNKNVQAFDPPTPSPPLFFGENELREFLILKLVSAENAALQSDKFSIPNGKARQGIFKTLVDTGLAAPTSSKHKHPSSLLSSNSILRSSKNGLDGYLSMMGGGSSPGQQSTNGNNNKANKSNNHFYGFNDIQHSTTPQRPKSAGPTGRNYTRASMRSLRTLESPTPKGSSTNLSPSSSSSFSLVTASRSLTPDPSSSSSSILFPYASKSNMLRDLKNFARRRHSTASSGSRTPTPLSIDRPSRTGSPIYSSYHSPTRRSGESPVSWTNDTSTMDSPTTMDIHHGSHDRLPPPVPTSSSSKSYLSSRSHSSSSLNAATTNTATTSAYYSPSSPPPIALDMMKWTTNKAVGGETNHSIRSRAQHLMSTVMMGRRKQQQPHTTATLLSTSPSPSCSSLSNEDNLINTSSSSSMISRMSRAKSSYLKD